MAAYSSLSAIHAAPSEASVDTGSMELAPSAQHEDLTYTPILTLFSLETRGLCCTPLESTDGVAALVVSARAAGCAVSAHIPDSIGVQADRQAARSSDRHDLVKVLVIHGCVYGTCARHYARLSQQQHL